MGVTDYTTIVSTQYSGPYSQTRYLYCMKEDTLDRSVSYNPLKKVCQLGNLGNGCHGNKRLDNGRHSNGHIDIGLTECQNDTCHVECTGLVGNPSIKELTSLLKDKISTRSSGKT